MAYSYYHHLLNTERKLIEISTLRVFLAAAEEKNFSNAAKRLHLSQSAVSQNIQSMERAYGVDLFIRHGRVVELTEAGQSILPMARDVLRAALLLEDGFQEITHQIGGELLIGCSTSAGKYLLPALLSDFQREYPAVHPRVKIMGREGVYERLLNQSIPIGVSSKYFDHRDLESVPLFDDRIYLIVPANHSWANYGKAVPDDLLDQRIIMREEISGTCETVMQGLKSYGITPDMLDVTMELGNPEAIEMAVERGVGIGFVSEMVAARGLAFGRVKKVELQGLDLKRTVYIARHLNHPLTRAQSLFWEFAKSMRDKLNTEIWDGLVNFEDVANLM
ncbi:MAG: LysR family transcriptional regulator [Chloroflexi bacterium]|nr:LysR family transcriptional regulator [Chloroflexota bacterium]